MSKPKTGDKSEAISKTMLVDHAKISRLLTSLEKAKCTETSEFASNFTKFRFEVERHFVVEETAIFSEAKSSNECYTIMQDLTGDHDRIKKLINQAAKDLALGEVPDITELKKVLLDHKNMEDREFYPLLDRVLTPEQKARIMKNISSPI